MFLVYLGFSSRKCIATLDLERCQSNFWIFWNIDKSIYELKMLTYKKENPENYLSIQKPHEINNSWYFYAHKGYPLHDMQ